MEFEPFVGLSLVIGIINLFIVLGCLVNAISCSNELKICRRQLNWMEYNVLTSSTASSWLAELKKEYDSNNRTHLRAFRHMEEVVRSGSLEGLAQQLQESRNRRADGLAAYPRPGESLEQMRKRWVEEQLQSKSDD